MADYTTSTDVLMSEAHEQARRLGIVSGDGSKHNDSVDAFRHAYASARLTQMYWDDAPRKFGLKHEQENLTDEFNKHKVGETVEMKTQRVEKVKSEIVMDLFNNEFGRDVARLNPSFTPDQLANHIYKRGIIENGLIQNLADPRIEEYKEYYLKQLDKNWLLSDKQPEQSQEQKQAKSQTLDTAWDIINAAYEASLSHNPNQALKQVMEQAENGDFGQQVKQEQVVLTQQYEEQQMQMAQQTLAEAQVIRGPVMSR